MAGISCARAAVASVLFGVFAGQALALDPSQAVGSYLHSNFTREDDRLPSDIVNVLLQTRDGFLWVGTSYGVARFDGRHFTTVRFSPEIRARGLTTALAEGPDGALWAGTSFGALRIPKEALNQFGRFPATVYHTGSGHSDEIVVLFCSREGVLFAGTNQGLYRFDGGAFSSLIPDVSVSRIEEARNGNLLVITGHGFIEWDGARAVPHPDLAARLDVPADRIFNVFEDHTGARWYSSAAGVAREIRGSIEHFQPYGVKPENTSYRAEEDRQGNIWVSIPTGLARANAGVLEPVPDTGARYIYPDRDGDLWLGTNGHGLIRLKDRILQTFSTADGVATDVTRTVLSTSDGKIWVGGNCGLSSFDGSQFRTYPDNQDGLTGPCVLSLAEDHNHDLWVGTYNTGVFRFHDGRFTQFSTAQGLAGDSGRSIVVSRDGSLWIATTGGISHMRDGHIRNYTTADGLPGNNVAGLYEDRRGVIWAATIAAIARLEADRFVSLPAAPEAADYILLGEDPAGSLYARASTQGTFRVERDRLVFVGQDVSMLAMAQSRQDLWLCGDVLSRAPLDLFEKWERERDAPRDYTRFDRADGFRASECGDGRPPMAIAGDGKLWVATTRGLAMIDAAHSPRVNRKPEIYMENIVIAGKVEAPGGQLVLPPGPHHVELHFAAIELRSPEKIRMQYRMDDVDREWVDADATNSAIYPSFPVGTHKFHVRACNRDGFWDRAGIAYNVIQQPYFYQTDLFRVAVVAMCGLLVVLMYQRRLRQMAAQMNARLDERVAERTRLARELHDTLLQTIQGSKIVADDALEDSTDPVRMRRALERLSIWLGQATEEGRAALISLRESTRHRNDLAEALRRAGEDCVLKVPMKFALTVEGETRDMHPIVRDEVYRIGYEAIRNACTHSQGANLSVGLSYARDLTLRVSDDGLGVDQKIVLEGKDGHFGLRGMQERAARIGARLTFHLKRPGTEVELIVPGNLTYREKGTAPPSRWTRLLKFFRSR
jgi:signal transduction histidine kinase/ligand-binding sensor domain-containing protein